MAKPENTCLIVDDVEFDRRMMRRVLAKHCPHIAMAVARDLSEARQKLKESEFAIVFLDNALPDGMGVDFLQEMVTDEALRHIPVVIVSDFPTPFMYAKAKAANVCAVWSKREFIGPSVQKVIALHANVQ